MRWNSEGRSVVPALKLALVLVAASLAIGVFWSVDGFDWLSLAVFAPWFAFVAWLYARTVAVEWVEIDSDTHQFRFGVRGGTKSVASEAVRSVLPQSGGVAFEVGAGPVWKLRSYTLFLREERIRPLLVAAVREGVKLGWVYQQAFREDEEVMGQRAAH